jgi:aminoglycoside phosphotransferase family enzyme
MAEGTTRVRTTDEKFFEVNEAVANDPSIEAGHTKEVATRLGLTEQSVQQRRSVFNRQYRDHGLTLTAFPKGGGRKKNIDSIAEKLLAMRADSQEQEQEQEQTETPSE